MHRLILAAMAAMMLHPASLAAQVNPVNDFFAGVSVLTTAGGAAGGSQTLVGWQASVSQKLKSATEAATTGDTPLSLVGDFAGQSENLSNGSRLHVSEFLGGVRARLGGRKRRESYFAHALFGATNRSGDANVGTAFMMGYGGGIDVAVHPSGPAYDFAFRVQFDWLPAQTSDAWSTKQFRVAVGLVFLARYWD